MIGALACGAAICLFSHSFFARGLNQDGAFFLIYMLSEKTISYWELSRTVFHFLYQAPAFLMMKLFPGASIGFLSRALSFSLIWIHIASLAGAWFILPKDRKRLIFYPLTGFFFGPVTALGISVSAALSVCSYIWFAAFLIRYSDLSKRIHQALFFLFPLPLFFSHEMISYAAWPLTGLCLMKIKDPPPLKSRFAAGKERSNKERAGRFQAILVGFACLSLFASSLLGFYFLFNHEKLTGTAHLSRFTQEQLSLKFLFKGPFYTFNLPLFIAVIAMTCAGLCVFFKKATRLKSLILKTLTAAAVFGAIWLFSSRALSLRDHLMPVFEYSVRGFAPLFGLPFVFLVYFLLEIRKGGKGMRVLQPAFPALCAAVFSLVFWRVWTDFDFHRHQKAVAKVLENCEGLLDYDSFRNRFKGEEKFLETQIWKMFYASLAYQESGRPTAALIESLSECEKNCALSLHLDCHDFCLGDRKYKKSVVRKLHENSGPYDMSRLTDSMRKNISRCEKEP